MASNDGGNLRVRISADLADIKQGLGLLRGELAKVKAEAAKTAPDTSAWSSGIGRIRQELGNLAGAYIGIQTITGGINALFDAVDRMDRIDELSQITGISSEELSKLAYAAKFGAVDIEVLSKGVAKLAKDMLSNKSLLAQFGIAVTDAAGKARSADQVLLDLADLFAKLPDGVEKNALAAKLFGERMGPGLIPLLNLGKQGITDLGVEAEKTGNVFSGEATAAAGQFNDMLDKLKLQAMGLANETAKNLLPAVAGYAETAVAAGENSNFAAEGGKFLSTVLKVLAAGGIVVKNVIEGLLNILFFLGTVSTEVGKVIQNTLVRNIGNLIGFVSDLVAGKNPIEAYRARLKDSFAGLADDAKSAFNGIRAGFSAMKDGLAESGRDIANIGALFSDAEASAKKGADGIQGAATQATPATQKLLDTIRRLLGEDGGGKGSKTKDKIDQLTASTVLLQDAVKRAQTALDQQYEDKQIGIADYYAKRVELQQQIIDLQVEQLQGELAVTKELGKRRQLEEQITILQRDRQQVAVDAARAQKKAEEELNKTKQEGYRDQLSNLTGGLSAQEGSLSAQMDAGAIGYTEGERRLQEVRAHTLEQLKALRVEQSAYLATLGPDSPEYANAQQTLLGIDTAIANITASMQQMKQGAMDSGVSALTNFFTNLRDGAMSAGEAFRTLVADFAKGIYDMIAQATAKRLVSAIANMFGGADESADVSQGAQQLSSAAATTTIAGGVIAFGARQLSNAAQELTAAASLLLVANSVSSYGAAHSGGKVGSLRMTRNNISPLVFGAAPRYHGGGVAGLQNDEIPAILKRGEIVRTRQQENALQARLNAGQGGGEQPIRNIIVFSEDELASALAGTAGEKVVVNHVRRNRGGING